jgi:hypothetical protein
MIDYVADVAQSLWIGAYWSDERHRAFRDAAGRSPVSAFGQEMSHWPTPHMPYKLVVDVEALKAKCERAWGQPVPEVAQQMRLSPSSLLWRTLMQAIGHGVGPEDDGPMPEGLSPDPLGNIEDPAEKYLPESETDLTGVPLD